VKLLGHYGAVAPEAQTATTEAGQWLDSFDQHLKCVIGCATGTRQSYLRYARHLLESRFALTRPDWQRLRVEDVADFVRRETEKLKPSHCRMPATATRAFLRFLVFKGEIHSGLLGAIPPIREWKHASLPLPLSDEELTRLIAVSEEASATRYRDRAILLLLVRLGLRANEVVNLRLDDIDWVQGRVLVQAGKTHRERSLPLARDVGEALVQYLKHERPKRNERSLFLGTRAPLRPLKNSSAITPIVTRFLKRANICRPHMGAHVLRHTAATKMLCAGAPFKQIADVLGHQSLRSTTIYAKLNLEMLARVALPWPGGAPC
jgi:site-specific recombinase XerD